MRYIATWKKQARGAIHYHIILFGFPYIPKKTLADIWGHGFIKINKTDVDSIENRGRYLSKYFAKDLELKEHKKKAFFKSTNLTLPTETKLLSRTPFDTKGKQILYEKEYTRTTPDFFKRSDGQLGFNYKESRVKYTKLLKKKQGGQTNDEESKLRDDFCPKPPKKEIQYTVVSIFHETDREELSEIIERIIIRDYNDYYQA